jgi:hypothetical protein
MPLSADSIIQSSTGSGTGSSVSVSLPGNTTAGNTVLIFIHLVGDTTGTWNVSTPNLFTDLFGVTGKLKCFVQANVGAFSGWTFSVIARNGVPTETTYVWAAYEIEGVDYRAFGSNYIPESVRPLVIAGDDTNVTSRSTGTTASSPSYDSLAFAVHGAIRSDTTPATFSDQTNGFIEHSTVSRAGAADCVSMEVSVKPSNTVGTYESTATLSSSSISYAAVIAFHAVGAKYAPIIDMMTGFEFGTATTMTNTSEFSELLVAGILDTVVGTPEVVSTFARTGTYSLKLSSTAAAESVAWSWAFGDPTTATLFSTAELPSGQRARPALRFHVYFDASLPSGDLELASVEAGSLANGLVVRYVSASQKIGVKSGTGTEVLSDATVAADKWIGIDVRYDAFVTSHLCDWQVDYDSLDTSVGPVAQTQAVGGSTSQANVTIIRLGWTTSSTATVYYDDFVFSKSGHSYPLGDIRIRPLKVDPAGTPSVIGSSANFRTWTNNGSLATWTAAGTRSALDDIPPTIGASSDGLTQIATAANDYVEIPMETFTAAPDNVLRAVRWYVAGWAVSGNPATIGVKFLDVDDPGVIDFIDVGDHGFDDTSLRWVTRMHRPLTSDFYQFTQARLDALRCRIGGSTDANPDVGIHCVLAELAYQPLREDALFGEPGGLVVTASTDPVSGAIIALVATAPAGVSADVTYEINGVEQTPFNVPASSTVTQVIDAPDMPTLNRISMVPVE